MSVPEKSTREELIQAAQAAAEMAYAPYSKLRVGAAVLAEDGSVYTGCNVENASYGLTICAERNAVGAMVLAGGKRVRTVAVVSPDTDSIFPCGACRQVLSEFGCEELLLLAESGIRQYPFSEILPHPFRSQ